VPLIAISSTDTITYEEDTYPKMVKKAQREHFNFPYLFDGDQMVAKHFAAQKTPHAFVIWKEKGQWVVKYNGAIDDNGAEPEKVEYPYVAKAVEALLAGKEVEVKETKSIGCQIHFRQ
jgi:peroxiredoxin